MNYQVSPSIIPLLQPGDVLLYDKPSLVNFLIKLKRGEQYSHVEVYEGNSKTLASRNGLGVARYDLNLDGLAAVYRVTPPNTINFAKGEEWFKTVDGEKYDWLGLMSFSWAKYRSQFDNNNKMFCSEFVTRLYRNCDCELFNSNTDADAISPEMITYSQKLAPFWLRADKQHGRPAY